MSSLEWIQLTIPNASAAVLARACQERMNNAESDAEYNILEQLRDFFEEAATNPRAFAPSGGMATKLKVRARRGRGVRRNDGSLKDGTARSQTKRASRRSRRARAAKQRRLDRREYVAAFNEARRVLEQEVAGG